MCGALHIVLPPQYEAKLEEYEASKQDVPQEGAAGFQEEFTHLQ